MPGGRFDQTGKGTIYRGRSGGAVERDAAGRSFEMVMTTLPGDQDIPCARLPVIAPAMRLDTMRPDHFPRIDDSSIWSGEKAEH
jgi:hypothetical protein